MTQLPFDSKYVATIYYELATIQEIRPYTGEPDWSDIPNEWEWFSITEAQLLTMNGFVRKRWEKALEGTKVPYTMPPSPSPIDQTF